MGAAPLVTDADTALIRVRGFRKSYRKRVAVDRVDLTVPRGTIFGLIGPDGAGKSSLMKAIAGVLAFDAGEVEVFDVQLDSEAAAERIKDRLGFMPQGLGLNLYPELTVDENIDFFARLRLVPEDALRDRKHRLLVVTRLDRFKNRPMKQLSGGMKQKLGLVCTLIHEPELVILDEPTTGVDPVSRRDFWTIVGELVAEKGITALVSTAYMDEVNRFHNIALLHAGTVLATGTPSEIHALAPGAQVLVQVDPPLTALAKLRQGFPQVETIGKRLCVYVDDATPANAEQTVRRALAGYTLHSIQAGEPDMEDMFIALLRRRGLIPIERVTVRQETPVNAASSGACAVEARDLTRDFGDFRAVDRANFTIAAGEIFGLLGANGAGKTTVIKMLTSLLRPTEGLAWVAGADVREGGTAVKERIGYMSQVFSLYLDLSVIENLRLYAGIYGLSRRQAKERIQWVIEMAGLAGHEGERPAAVPVGLRQRLALGCALVHRPRVLFLDEPTSGVDPVGRRRFWDVLFRLAREDGVAILVTTHYMSESEHCDRLALMYAGRIVADATPSELKQSLEDDAGELLEIDVADSTGALTLLRDVGFANAYMHGARVRVFARAPGADRHSVQGILENAGVRVVQIKCIPPSMEDVFVYRITALERAAAEVAA